LAFVRIARPLVEHINAEEIFKIADVIKMLVGQEIANCLRRLRGRPSIAPERLLRALLLPALYSIRRETQLMEQLDYNLLYRWFVGLNADDRVWDVTVFTKNRERLMDGEVLQRLLEAVVRQAAEHELLSEEHFTVDGTLIEAWASRTSFRPKEKPPEKGSGSGGKKLLCDTHESKSDPEARLYKRSAAGPARPSYLGHVMIENRRGLVAACATQSNTTAEREAALRMLDQRGRSPGQKSASKPDPSPWEPIGSFRKSASWSSYGVARGFARRRVRKQS
jgi:transposase